MPDNGEQRGARSLVRKHMLRVDDDGRPHRPRNQASSILIFEGSGGSGKTMLLEGIAADLAHTVPFASFDFQAETKRDATVGDVLAILAWDLGRWWPVYGSLAFPRFAIGQKVKQLDLDMTQPRPVLRRAVLDAVGDRRRAITLRQVLQDVVLDVVGQIPVPTGIPLKTLSKYTLQFAFDLLDSRIPRLAPGPYVRWYAGEANAVPGDGIDVLIDLQGWANSTTPADQTRATELLSAAFLADLQDAFHDGRRSGEWSFNSVLLLDNVESGMGPKFLDELGRARARHREQRPDGADPLTVVAASRARLPANEAPVERVTLRPLSEANVHAMAKTRRIPTGDLRRLAARIYAFTCGHPASVGLLLDAAAGCGTADVELNGLLEWRNPKFAAAGQEPPATADLLCQRLLAGVPDAEVDDLVTLSAARDRDQALLLAARSKLVRAPQPLLVPDRILWAADDTGTVLLRRLLLRRLAARGPEDRADWATVHGALRRLCHEAGERDTVGELYHALAAGDLQFVVTELARRLTESDTAPWLELLAAVTAAPRRPGGRPPHDQVTELSRTVTVPQEKLAPLAGLIVGLWIAADPATPGNRRLLHLGIALNYSKLTDPAKDPALIVAEAANHTEAAKTWQ